MWDAWPLQKTFVDGRALNESVFRDYMQIAYNYRDAQTLLDSTACRCSCSRASNTGAARSIC